MKPSARERDGQITPSAIEKRKLPQSGSRTLSDGSRAPISPVVDEFCLWDIHGCNGGDGKVGVFKGRITQAESELITRGDVFLETINGYQLFTDCLLTASNQR